MRVWALASCSGLLALAACSAEQSSSPNPSAAPLDGEDTADIQAQPGLTALASSPMARPEVRPRPVIQGGYRLSSASGKPVATAATSSDKALPQAAELRQRLERLRSQQNARLSSSTPLVTAPQSAALVRPAPSRPAAEPALPAFNPVQSSSLSTQGVTPLPTPLRPTPIEPEANLPTASTAAALGEVTTASVARTYPIAPLRHQGYSARAQRPAPVLSVAHGAGESSSTARLHGSTLTAQQPESLAPGEISASPVAIVEGSTSPQPNGLEGSAVATDPPAPTIAVRAESSASAPGAATDHQSSGPVALTPVVQPTAGLEADGKGHQSQAVSAAVASVPVNQAPALWESARAEAAIAPPESLPLNPPSSRPSLVSPRLPESAAETDDSTPRIDLSEASAISERTPVSSPVPNAARIAAPASQPVLPDPGSRLPEATTSAESSTTPELHHQSQVNPEAIRLISTASNSSKGLPIAYCLSPSGQPVPTTLEAQGSSASLPQFSPSNQADPSLDLASTLNKENPVALCVDMPSSAPELNATPLAPSLDAQSQP